MKKLIILLGFVLSICTFVKAQSCQPFTIQIDSQLVSHPILEFYAFNLCSGDTLTIAAKADFPNNNFSYFQTQSNTKFIWQFGSLPADTAAIVTKQFDQSKMKNFILRAVDVNGCYSSNQIYGKVLTSGTPIISIDSTIYASVNSIILLNASQDNSATLLFQPIEILQPPDSLVYVNNDTVFLPDGNNICYNDELTITNFDNNQVILYTEQIKSIVLNMEHSYLEDLSIRLTCPSGKEALLKSRNRSFSEMPPGGVVANLCSSYGGPTNLGCAVDAPSPGPCYLSPGIGFDYEFRPGATGCFGTGGATVVASYIDECGTPWSVPTLRPSSPNIYTATVTPPVFYGSYQNLSSLIGCPLNGNWKITVCDHTAFDNGFIFYWGINFSESLIGNSTPYIVDVDSVTWSGQNLTTIDLFSASVYHTTPALFNYSALVHDHFGCQYNAAFTINTTVSIEDLSNELSAIKIFPNPTNAQVYIINETETIKMIQLYSMNGLLLFEKYSEGFNQVLDLSLYQSGVYICKVTTSNGESKQVKIIKK